MSTDFMYSFIMYFALFLITFDSFRKNKFIGIYLLVCFGLYRIKHPKMFKPNGEFRQFGLSGLKHRNSREFASRGQDRAIPGIGYNFDLLDRILLSEELCEGRCENEQKYYGSSHIKC